MSELDEDFFNRADEHIHLSNRQLKSTTRGKVSASMMYSVARFNAWVSACGWKDQEEMAKAKDAMIEYFVAEYRKMLEENFADYLQNFDTYMEKGKKT